LRRQPAPASLLQEERRLEMPGCIVCGVEDSEVAMAAARLAARLSEALGSRLVLVHVDSASPPLVVPAEAAPLGAHLPAEALDRDSGASDPQLLLEQIAWEEGLHGAELLGEVGAPADRIVAVAAEAGADLIVIGSRRRGVVSSIFFGSVSADVASQAPCPVVIVPKGAEVRDTWLSESTSAG
jgi:nucleotide-binding universal stress UspA family protein